MVRLQRELTGIGWASLNELFRLANLAGREGDKVRRSFQNSDLVLFALDGEVLVGAARVLTDFEYHATIYDLVVHPHYQRTGLGTRMMQELLSALPVWRVLLVAEPDVQPFYQRLGFKAYGNVLAKLDAAHLIDAGRSELEPM